MEELIGLLLVLLFGGIEAWNKAKKKKMKAGSKQRAEAHKGSGLPEAWPAVPMEVAPVPQEVMGSESRRDGGGEAAPSFEELDAEQPVLWDVPVSREASSEAHKASAAGDLGDSTSFLLATPGFGKESPMKDAMSMQVNELATPGFGKESPIGGAGVQEKVSEDSYEESRDEVRLPGTDLSMRDAVIASVIVERKYS